MERTRKATPITHDRFGHRVDEVDFHPAYHQLMDLGVSSASAVSLGLTWGVYQ